MNTLKTNFTKILTALTFSTLCVAFTSSANPIVTDWDYIVDSTFTNWTDNNPVNGINDGITASGPNSLYGGATRLEWGTGDNGPSHLDINSGTAGHLVGSNLAMGDMALITTLTHNNFPINGQTLQSATLRTGLQLDGGVGFNPLAILDFGITFKETTNSVGGCGYNARTSTLCDDIFIIDPPAGVTGFFDFNLNAFIFNQMFNYGGHSYVAQLIVSGLAPLLPEAAPGTLPSACAFAGVAEGCIGFLTEESTINAFTVDLRVLAVPEPSSILLMSLALFGIFASSRNKHI